MTIGVAMLVWLLLPLCVSALVIAIAWKTIPGFAERPEKRVMPMLLAVLAGGAILFSGARIWLAPALLHQRNHVTVPCEKPNKMVELRGSHVIEIWRGIPNDAYLIAEAMIKERAK